MSALQTPLCTRLGIDLPIISAPISSSPEFIAAVSAAGGLGVIQATWLSREALRDVIAEIRTRTTRPFAANFVLSLTEADNHANIDLALELGVGLISTFWGDPQPVVKRVHDAGALSLHTVGSAKEARRAVDLGVDAVVAQGVEAGGHVWGEVGTFVLVPAVVDAVPDTPVIAAGGIADGRGLAAALALGAQAVWVGTRFLLADECTSHPSYKDQIAAACETDTVLSSLFDIGWPDAPHRCLMNDTIREWVAAGRPTPGQRPNEGGVVGADKNGAAILRYDLQDPLKSTTGAVGSMALYAGQGAALAKSRGPIAQILRTMASDAARLLA